MVDGTKIGSNYDAPGVDGIKRGQTLVAHKNVVFSTYIGLYPDKDDTPVKLASRWVPVAITKWKFEQCASRTVGTTDDFIVAFDNSKIIAGWKEFEGDYPSWKKNLKLHDVLKFKELPAPYVCE